MGPWRSCLGVIKASFITFTMVKPGRDASRMRMRTHCQWKMPNISQGEKDRSPSTIVGPFIFLHRASLRSQDHSCSTVIPLRMPSPTHHIRTLLPMRLSWSAVIQSVGPSMTRGPASFLQTGQEVTVPFLQRRSERIPEPSLLRSGL